MTWKLSYEEFVTILKEKDKYEKMKESVRNVTEKLEEKPENMRINSINLKKNELCDLAKSIEHLHY